MLQTAPLGHIKYEETFVKVSQLEISVSWRIYFLNFAQQDATLGSSLASFPVSAHSS